MKSTPLRLASFIAVGGVAACVHFGVVVALVEGLGAPPLAANVGGWLVALSVSFMGQWLLTFRSRGTPWRRALPRFAAVSLAGFAMNESAYAVLLHATAVRYDLLLVLVLVGVAIFTYLLSSRWAFRDSRAS